MAKKQSVSSQPEKLVVRTAADTRRYRKSPQRKIDIERALAIRDEDIDYSDIPQLSDEELSRFVPARLVRKVPVSLRIDGLVLEWLKSKGKGHLTRINEILLRVMEAERRVTERKGAR